MWCFQRKTVTVEIDKVFCEREIRESRTPKVCFLYKVRLTPHQRTVLENHLAPLYEGVGMPSDRADEPDVGPGVDNHHLLLLLRHNGWALPLPTNQGEKECKYNHVTSTSAQGGDAFFNTKLHIHQVFSPTFSQVFNKSCPFPTKFLVRY